MLKTNAFDPANSHAISSQTLELIERRRRILGPAYELFYENPLHLVKGEGVWVYDADGRRYLDMYNNVPSVGHCHPHVLEALYRQASTLNTHTRYLHENILNFSEKLISTMPPELSQVMFTCTGSEANDLALRIAEHYTGGTGVIITDYSYHGMTSSIAALSASMSPGITISKNARTIPAPIHNPDNPDEVGKKFAADVRAALVDMKRHGIKPAALMIDTFFTSDGGFFDPAGFLKEAIDVIHEAGALYIADEVQPGYGRSGETMWGFQRHGLLPDIVTLGKPMGNGHPMAGLVIKPEILHRFGTEASYFNTFAGNTVSAAVGLAVLEVIEQEGLIESVGESGRVLLNGMTALQDRFGIMSQVRGVGLFVSAEFVNQAGEPDSTMALKVVNTLREEGVLIGASGPHANILKIRPPLVFKTEHAHLFLASLEKVLQQVS